MKVTHEIDHTTGEVRVTAIWTLKEQQDADRAPGKVHGESSAAEILLDAERVVRRIETHQRARG